jgi:hypothetical protein
MPAGEILDCQTCHRELSGMPAGEILDCQAAGDVISTIGRNLGLSGIGSCQACQREKSWIVRHAIGSCQACHREKSWIVRHAIGSCQACQREKSWIVRQRELSGMPAGEILDCQACHREKSWNDYRFLPLVEMTDRQKKFN